MSEYIKSSEMDNYLGMLEELFSVEHGLTNWEIDFLESLNDWDGSFTIKQAEKLQSIYYRLL